MTRCGAVGSVLLATAILAAAEPPRSYFDPVPAKAADIWNDATLLVEGVVAFSPADDAGLQAGDRVIGLNQVRVRTHAEMALAKDLLGGRSGLRIDVVRDGNLLSLPLPPLDEGGRIGIDTTSPVLSGDRAAFESLGIAPAEYLGAARGGRDDGGALDALLAAYAPTNPTRSHPVLLQFAAFPARASERIRTLGATGRPGAREWVLGLMKTYYALVESRWDDAKQHIESARLKTTPMDPFLDGLADFYSRLAATPPDATRGVVLDRHGVTPEYFALCCPPPVAPLKLHDWTGLSRAFAADFVRRAEGLPWNRVDYERAAQREFAVNRSTPALDYLSLTRGALLYPEVYGGYPTRYTPLGRPDQRAQILSDLKGLFDTDARQRTIAALALIVPSALSVNTNVYREAMTALRDAGSREIGLANAFTREIWMRHGRLPAYTAFEAIRREVNESLGIPGVYPWFAARNRVYADRLQRGWYYLHGSGLSDGSPLLRTAATVEALGGPVELEPPPAAR